MNDTPKRDKAAKPSPGPSDPEQIGLGLGAEAPAASYRVLARKYRPSNFDDLIGQEAMVRTISNAFETGRIPQAWILTGVRGVGKTTTARIVARALNYELPDGSVKGPTIAMPKLGVHCQAIMESRHIDVIEMDAASHNGVDDIRQINDAIRYAPVSARYKVYILDEVHMLSTQAFNALLKTLEEPPPHAKFIFATTEIRKVPVTILSRTQRFDLRRVEPEVIVKNLEMISEAEGARVEADGLMLIARAAEGSVRDAQSMLDQAIVQAEPGQTVTAATIRDMLGLADRAQTISLFEQIMRGEAGPAIETFRTLYGYGANPDQVMLDLLDRASTQHPNTPFDAPFILRGAPSPPFRLNGNKIGQGPIGPDPAATNDPVNDKTLVSSEVSILMWTGDPADSADRTATQAQLASKGLTGLVVVCWQNYRGYYVGKFDPIANVVINTVKSYLAL